MAFSKFDPHRPEQEEEMGSAERRALLLRWGWFISVAYTAVGFGFIVYWMFFDG